MSVIHSSWVLLGRRSLLMAGTARYSTVRSIEYSTAASASTASPVHSRRPALRTPPVACWPGLFMRVLLLRVGARRETRPADLGARFGRGRLGRRCRPSAAAREPDR